MLFNSHFFMLVFMPVTVLIFERVRPQRRLIVLAAASLIFYGIAGWKELAALLLVIIWVHAVTQLKHAGLLFRKVLVVSFPLLVLILFRYLNFILDNIDAGMETRRVFSFFLDVLVPAGISFYTFQIIAYGIDVINGTVPREKNLLKLATFISFFPQLIAGPIVRYRQITGQLDKLSRDREIVRNFGRSFQYIVVGLVYKVFIADFCRILHDKFILSADASGLDTWVSIFLYSMVIYYDFYGYSLIAIGLAGLFGISLPDNFNRPYQSLNPKDFWRRWHITLSYWLRDYIYIPLGGNRRRFLAILIVFGGCGLWHGANWNFLIWGLYHALLVLSYGLVAPIWDRLPNPIQVGGGFLLVTIGWPLFYLDIYEFGQLLINLAAPTTWYRKVFEVQEIIYLTAVMVWTLTPRSFAPRVWKRLEKMTLLPPFQAALAALATYFFVITNDFIYFRF